MIAIKLLAVFFSLVLSLVAVTGGWFVQASSHGMTLCHEAPKNLVQQINADLQAPKVDSQQDQPTNYATLLQTATQSVEQIWARYNDALVPAQLTAIQFVILSELEAQKSNPPQPAALALTILLDLADLYRDLHALEHTGLVRSTSSSERHPNQGVELTHTGYAKLRQARPLWRRAQAQWDAALGIAFAADLRDTLALMASLNLVASLNFKPVFYDHATT